MDEILLVNSGWFCIGHGAVWGRCRPRFSLCCSGKEFRRTVRSFETPGMSPANRIANTCCSQRTIEDKLFFFFSLFLVGRWEEFWRYVLPRNNKFCFIYLYEAALPNGLGTCWYTWIREDESESLFSSQYLALYYQIGPCQLAIIRNSLLGSIRFERTNRSTCLY